jgi:hypothetical protein
LTKPLSNAKSLWQDVPKTIFGFAKVFSNSGSLFERFKQSSRSSGNEVPVG